jgi:hypothetical protein
VANGKIERRITVATGTGTVNDGGGADAFTVAPGSYYMSTTTSLISTLETALETASGVGFTVTGSFGESGTGKTTIAINSGTFTLSWTDTDLRDALGFTGNLTPAAASFTSTNASSAVWLAPCPCNSPFGAGDNGWEEADVSISESPAGNVYAVYGQRKRACWFQWEAVSHARARIAGESVVNESFQKFFRDSLLAEAGFSGGVVAGPVRIHWDADSTSQYVTCKLSGGTLRRIQMEMLADRWVGLWDLKLERVVEVPS